MKNKIVDIKPYQKKRLLEKLAKEKTIIVFPKLHLVVKDGKPQWVPKPFDK
jgi:hypothetical protein